MILAPLLFLVFAQPVSATESPGAERLVGVVVDSDGKPLAGADVWLASGLPPSGERPLIGGALWMQRGRPSLGESNAALGTLGPIRAGSSTSKFPPKSVGARSPWGWDSGPMLRERALRRGDCRGAARAGRTDSARR